MEDKEYSLNIKPFIYDDYGDGASVIFEADMTSQSYLENINLIIRNNTKISKTYHITYP